MLAISGFRPIKNNYSAKNINTQQYRQTGTPFKVDSVCFKANAKSDYYIASYLRMHSDCLGDAFKQEFDELFNKFLKENGLCVKYYPTQKSVRVEKEQSRGQVDSYLGHLQLLGENGQIPHLLGVDGLTKNDVNVRLIQVLLSSKTDLKISDKLRDNTIKIGNIIDRFWGEWTMAIKIDRGYDANAKAKDLQLAISELIPEK